MLTTYKLSQNQLDMCNLILSQEIHRMTIAEMCDEVGISVTTYYNWKKNKEFNKYLEELEDEQMRNFLGTAYKRLRNIVTEGSDKDALRGIEMVLKAGGKLQNDTSVNVQVNNVQSTEELEREILEMEQELLQEGHSD